MTQSMRVQAVTAKREDEALRDLTYSEIASKTSDDVATAGRAKKLYPYMIAMQGMTPQDVVERLRGRYVLVLRRSWRGESLLIAAFIISVVISLLWNLQTFGELLYGSSVLFLPATILAALLHRRFNRKCILSADALTVIQGLIGINLFRVRIPIDQIKALEMKRSVIQRILNVGDIQVSTIMFDQPQVDVQGLVNPLFYVGILRTINQDLNQELPVAPKPTKRI